MLNDYEFYASKLRSYKEPLYAPMPFTNRQVTLAKNSLVWLMKNAPAREVDKALVSLIKRDPDFFDCVLDRLEVDYQNPDLIRWLRSWTRGKVVIEGR